MRSRLNGELTAMRAVRAHAEALKPTKQLAPYQAALLQALQFRVTGLQCLAERITTAWKLKHPLAAGQQLYSCTGQLLASDYVYADSFATSADLALKQVGATGVPTSQFLPASELNLVTPIGIGQALQRLHPGAVKGVHGTEMGAVVASPRRLTLQPGTDEQGGGEQEAGVRRLGQEQRQLHRGRRAGEADAEACERRVGRRSSRPSTSRASPRAQTATVRFTGLFASAQTAPDYSVPYKLTVTSLKVPGEHNLTNNTATFTVEFSIAS